MAHDHASVYQPNAKARKQQEKDQRRMEFRRAIESYCDQRQLLRDIAEGRNLGDVTTLADASVMNLISSGLSAGKGED